MGHDVGGRSAPAPRQGSISIDSVTRVPLRSTLGYIPAAASRLNARGTVFRPDFGDSASASDHYLKSIGAKGLAEADSKLRRRSGGGRVVAIHVKVRGRSGSRPVRFLNSFVPPVSFGLSGPMGYRSLTCAARFGVAEEGGTPGPGCDRARGRWGGRSGFAWDFNS